LQWTRLSIKEIAAEVGFDDPFYFSVQFRKRLGKSPRAFRETAMNESAF
jgi:AraC-like DNA-binding protein